MSNLFKNMLFFIVLTSGGWLGVTLDANAQCVPSPRIMGQGPQGGSPCWGGNQVVIPQGVQVGQPFNTNVNGQNMRCTWKDRAATAAVDGLAGGAFATAAAHVAKLFKADVSANRAAVAGALAGAGAGATFLCEPDMVDDGDKPMQVASAQTRTATCRDSAEVPLKLNLPGHPKHNAVVCMRPDDPNRAY